MSHRLQVLIPESLEARLAKAAQRRRLSKGEWVRRAIEQALTDNRYNKTRAAAQLGITFRALRYKLKKLGID